MQYTSPAEFLRQLDPAITDLMQASAAYGRHEVSVEATETAQTALYRAITAALQTAREEGRQEVIRAQKHG